ncbi:TonB-dependent receptor plug domain-containing protein [Pseudomonas putida]
MPTQRINHPLLALGRRPLLLASAPLLSLLTTDVFAEQGETKPTTALAPVTVTAQRQEESAQDIGIALTALSGQDLQDKGVTGVNQLQNYVPNLDIAPQYGSGNPLFRIRGVGLKDYGSNNTSTVGVYLDQVALPYPIQTQGQLFDLERVEVLRGPQGTLYGRNSTAGAINFITNKPTRELHGGLTGNYGSYHASNLRASSPGPSATPCAGAWRSSLNRAAPGRTTASPGKAWATRTPHRCAGNWTGTPATTSISTSLYTAARTSQTAAARTSTKGSNPTRPTARATRPSPRKTTASIPAGA